MTASEALTCLYRGPNHQSTQLCFPTAGSGEPHLLCSLLRVDLTLLLSQCWRDLCQATQVFVQVLWCLSTGTVCDHLEHIAHAHCRTYHQKCSSSSTKAGTANARKWTGLLALCGSWPVSCNNNVSGLGSRPLLADGACSILCKSKRHLCSAGRRPGERSGESNLTRFNLL